MKLISWNVNGLRAIMGKNFMEFFNEADADIFCLQETKLQEGQIDMNLPGYHQYWNYAEKKGYSGTAIFTKKEPKNVTYGIGIDEHDREGRVITLEFDDFFMVDVYTPNSQNELARLDYRMTWEDAFLNMLLYIVLLFLLELLLLFFLYILVVGVIFLCFYLNIQQKILIHLQSKNLLF